jgi:hypothetical protein
MGYTDGVEDALQDFGGFFNQPIGNHMKKVLATLIAGFVAASVFAASPAATPAPSTTATATDAAKPAAVTKKHKASKESKKKISPAAKTPASAVVK